MKIIRPFATAAVLLFSAFICSATTAYTDQSSFLNDIAAGYYLEGFDTLTTGQNLPNTLNFSGNGYSYQGVASGGYAYGNGTFYGTYYDFLASGCCNESNPILSVTQQGTEIVLNFSSNVTAVGGNFFMVDNDSDVTDGVMTLQLADGTLVTVEGGAPDLGTTYLLPNAVEIDTNQSPPFVGFTSQDPITSLTINSNRFTGLDDIYVGTSLAAEAVPEPWTAGLVLPGFGLIFAARRWSEKRKSSAS